MVKIAHLIPLFPFLAFGANIFFGKKLKSLSAIVSIAASGVSLVLSLMVFQRLGDGEGSYSLGQWLTIDGRPLIFGITLDGLSVLMLLIVTIIGTLIQIYSIGYMRNDPRYSRYFAYMSLFMASMLGLVLADNFVMFYIFWEGVGLCSYLLISFWFERQAAAKAGLKAFITTRIGDTGLFIGILLLMFGADVFSFQDLAHVNTNDTLPAMAALLIFFGAVGKSAQFPLHVWLPDAMEGPTAVSALIHAATMVAAGIYLVARSYALFAMHPLCLQIVAVTGGISALMAASIATVNNDIKRVLAYSTISQLGLMMIGLGAGSVDAGMFHLMTHAFFKALLFLCAGSIIHAVHTQNIQKMGGLFSKMKVTAVTFMIGALAIAGVPPLAGFWSKDEILSQVMHNGHPVLFYIILLTNLLTAFYMARLIFLVLCDKPRSQQHAHESAKTMTIPLIILAVFAMSAGLIGSPLMHHAFQKFVSLRIVYPLEDQHPSDYGIMGLSLAVSFIGIGAAYLFYINKKGNFPATLREKFPLPYQILLNKYYMDEIYDALFVRPFWKTCRLLFKFDAGAIDGLVNAAARGVLQLSKSFQRIQTGLVQDYLLVQILGALIFILALIGKICFHS